MLFSFGLGLWVAWVCLCLVLPQNIRRTDGEGKRSAIIIIIISVDKIINSKKSYFGWEWNTI